jgi:hypothetical protein
VVEFHWKSGLCASREVFYLDNFVVKQLENFGKFCFSRVNSHYFCIFGNFSPIHKIIKKTPVQAAGFSFLQFHEVV